MSFGWELGCFLWASEKRLEFGRDVGFFLWESEKKLELVAKVGRESQSEERLEVKSGERNWQKRVGGRKYESGCQDLALQKFWQND